MLYSLSKTYDAIALFIYLKFNEITDIFLFSEIDESISKFSIF